MKKIVSLTSVLIIVIMLLLLLSVNTLAATNSVEMFLDVDINNCIFTITWSNQEQTADIEIVSHEGKKFGNLVTPAQTTVSEGAMYINVGTATAGAWDIVITGTALGRVNVYAGELPGAMSIDIFHVEKTESGYNAYWDISEALENLTVDIYVDTDASGYDGVKTASFLTNPEGKGFFSLYNLDTGVDTGEYYFYMKAYDSSGVFDYKYTEAAFRHENTDSCEKLEQGVEPSANEDGTTKQSKIDKTTRWTILISFATLLILVLILIKGKK